MQDYLIVDTELLNPATLQQILRKFPRISSFEFLQKDLFLPHLCTLLKGWREQLSILRVLICSPHNESHGQEWSQLLRSLKGS